MTVDDRDISLNVKHVVGLFHPTAYNTRMHAFVQVEEARLCR